MAETMPPMREGEPPRCPTCGALLAQALVPYLKCENGHYWLLEKIVPIADSAGEVGG